MSLPPHGAMARHPSKAGRSVLAAHDRRYRHVLARRNGSWREVMAVHEFTTTQAPQAPRDWWVPIDWP
jgi:ribosomal protein L34